MSLDFEILYEDEDLLVINKPPGVITNRAETTSEPTIQDWMAVRLRGQTSSLGEWQALVPPDFQAEFGSPEEIMTERQGIVHRLDKDTSGVMILAKNPGSLVALLAQFRNRETTKQYVTLVHGKFSVPEAILDLPMGRASRDRKVFSVRADGRPAVTKYRVRQTYSEVDQRVVQVSHPELDRQTLKRFSIYQGFSLVECWPKTGRTHQIRVHLAHIQHPLVGDTTYIGKKRKALDPLWCPRQFLHAESLELRHPRTGKKLKLEAKLFPDLQAVLTLLH